VCVCVEIRAEKCLHSHVGKVVWSRVIAKPLNSREESEKQIIFFN
jgi:hypothetical protein